MTTSDDLGSYIDKTIKQEASALVVQLDNEYIGITTDSNGNGTDIKIFLFDHFICLIYLKEINH